MKRLVGIDVDDVLGGFYSTACRKFGKTPITTDIWNPFGHCRFIPENWEAIKNDKDLWANMDVLVDPKKDLDFDFECYISAFPEERIPERLEWLHKNGFPDKPLYRAADKVKLAKEVGINTIIDDKIDTIRSFNAESGMWGIWYRPHYMIYRGQIADNFETVKKYLRNADFRG